MKCTVDDAIPKRKRLIGQFHLMYAIMFLAGFQIKSALIMPDAGCYASSYKVCKIQYIAEMA